MSEDGEATTDASPLVVALCASAGGVEVLQEILRDVPVDLPAAFVVAMHLDPTRPSHLHEVLAAHTALEVVQAEDGTALAAGRVHVLPSDRRFAVEGSVLRAIGPAVPGDRSRIDAFLRSLAEERGPNCACVILSGTGSDGTLGMRAVSEAGGLTLVQDPETAGFGGMPASAASSGYADRVVPPEEVLEHLRAFAGHAVLVETLAEEPRSEEEAAGGGGDPFSSVLEAIQHRTGHDFRGYKKSTLRRRIARRMGRRGVGTLEGYAALLREEPEEAEDLFREMLIGVTRFFRDSEAMEHLATEALPELLSSAEGRAIRVWVPGCSTGEEAYSLAILFDEVAEREGVSLHLQVFSTDVDERAIERARRATFPQGIGMDVSPERLQRYFRMSDGSYKLVDRIRETCIFSIHDLTRDPPFSRLDLVSCRNLLIYLDSSVQERLTRVFHYALRPGGLLLLGPVEGIHSSSDLFESVDRRLRIFRRKDVSARVVPGLPPAGTRWAEPGARKVPARVGEVGPSALARTMERKLLEVYSPPAVLVGPDREILSFFGDTAPYLRAPAGTSSIDLVEMARPKLGPDLRTALHVAASRGVPVTRMALEVDLGGAAHRTRVDVHPVGTEDSPLFLVTFQAAREGEGEPWKAETADTGGALEALEAQLLTTREELNATIEELEFSNEQQRSANEELLSMNEELQSSNEELETAKEELHSTNEELSKVNAELETKVEELVVAKSDIENLFATTEVATLFLDRDLRLKRFTRPATEIFHVLETDHGRPITHFAHHVEVDDLAARIREVLESLHPVREIVRSGTGKRFEMRILPYCSLEHTIEGVVLSFVDITSLMEAEERIAALNRELRRDLDERTADLAVRQGLLEALLRAAPDPIVVFDREGRIEELNLAGERLFQRTGSEVVGETIGSLLEIPDGGSLEESVDLSLGPRTGAGPARWGEVFARRRDGSGVSVRMSVDQFRFEDESKRVAVLHDLTEERLYQEELERRVKEQTEEVRRLNRELQGQVVKRTAELEVAVQRSHDEAGERAQAEARLAHADRLVSIGTLAAGVAHEINNPAAYLEANLTMLRDALVRLDASGADPGVLEDAREMLADCAEGVRRISVIVRDLRSFARTETAAVGETDLREVARAACHLAEGEVKPRGRLVLDLDEVPLIVADRDHLVQVVVNLLINAAQALDEGTSGEPRVEVRTRASDEEVVLSVEDTGPGMTEEILERIFEPFFTTKPPGVGTGLGLPLGEEIARRHGGSLRVVSRPGEGTRFDLVLPRETGLRPEPAPDHASPASLPPGCRILVVDDDGLVLRGVRRLLENEAEVTVAASAEEALRALEAGPDFDVVLCDMIMPGTDGLELLAQLELEHPRTAARTLFLTGGAERPEIERFAAENPERVLLKPVDRPSLLAALERVARRSRPAR